jgi:hypothetical protein
MPMRTIRPRDIWETTSLFTKISLRITLGCSDRKQEFTSNRRRCHTLDDCSHLVSGNLVLKETNKVKSNAGCGSATPMLKYRFGGKTKKPKTMITVALKYIQFSQWSYLSESYFTTGLLLQSRLERQTCGQPCKQLGNTITLKSVNSHYGSKR